MNAFKRVQLLNTKSQLTFLALRVTKAVQNVELQRPTAADARQLPELIISNKEANV